MPTTHQALTVGDVRIPLRIHDGSLLSLGAVEVGGLPLRGDANRFLPWFDSYDGHVFRSFRFVGARTLRDRTTITTRAISDPDSPFMERRDSSGDQVLRQTGWDAQPVEADLQIHLEPARATLDGHAFTGFKYWFEYRAEAPAPAIHRLLDRQTWELGGSLDAANDIHVAFRNLFDLPRKKLTRETGFSTVGLDNWAGALPGNLWGRWSLLQPFDMQYGDHGSLIAWFDRVSNIRSVLESTPGEDSLRVVDFHFFEQSRSVTTNPKTVLFCPDKLDHTDALNLWTRVFDQEHDKALRQFNIRKDDPPEIMFGHNVWQDFHFDKTYEQVVDEVADFGADLAFIDSVFENGETFRREIETRIPKADRESTVLGKFQHGHMCLTIDFEVSKPAGGEERLKALCDRAAAKGVRVMSWMSTHYWPRTKLANERKTLGHGSGGIYAVKESGFHPDTGYAGDCWPANMNAPIGDRLRAQILGMCRRTGLSGFLWDSFSNIGWWQIDFSAGNMKPQLDRTMELYAALVNEGLYIQTEAMVFFNPRTSCGLFGGNVYAGDLIGYSYNTTVGLEYPDENGKHADHADLALRGKKPIDELFQCFANRRAPCVGFHRVPKNERDPAAVEAIKTLFRAYRATRGLMKRRTVLKDGAGVRWDNETNTSVIYAFRDIDQPISGRYTRADSGEPHNGSLRKNHVYMVTP